MAGPTKRDPRVLKTHTKALIKMTGISPFVMDNIRGADPDDPLTIEIKALTDKGSTMTPEERDQRDALRWRRSLYQDDSGALVYPMRNVLVAIAEAGVPWRAKTQIIDRGAVTPLSTELALIYQGPDGKEVNGSPLGPGDLKELYNDPRFRFRALVNGNPSSGKRRSMVPAMRPIFPIWRMEAQVVVFHNEIGWDKFLDIIAAAGRMGIGNARKIGMGKFMANVTEL
jgi:hypothetical protein